MADPQPIKPIADVQFCSSIKNGVWHDLAGPNAFESWHFDAVSDDGREALVVAFYDNYVLSPRFVANSGTADNVTLSGRHRFPAVSFVYSVDGTPVLSSVNEYVEGDFRSLEPHGCNIAESSFKMATARYGSGFVVSLDLATFRGRRIKAELEWLLIEADLEESGGRDHAATWNAIAPRADVSGKIMLIGRRGKIRKTINFRGTGYHDQVSSANLHYRDLSSRMWGRAHYIDSTVIFDRLGGVQDMSAPGTFYVVRDGQIEKRDAACEASEYRRDHWGLVLPRRISFTSADNTRVRIKPLRSFRSGLTEVKMLSEITLSLRDGKPRKSIGITEFVDPRRLKNPLFRWISDLRIGSEDRSPLF